MLEHDESCYSYDSIGHHRFRSLSSCSCWCHIRSFGISTKQMTHDESASILSWYEYINSTPEWIDNEEELYAKPC